MSNTPALNVEQTAADFKQAVEGKMPPEQIAAVTNAMAAAATGYAANGSIASLIFYFKIQVTIKNGKTFNGQAGGIGFPGGGATFGTVYTDDINRLYSSTHSFQWLGTAVYFTVNFFDSSSNFLGTYQAGAVSIAIGTGGGTGGWS